MTLRTAIKTYALYRRCNPARVALRAAWRAYWR